MNRYYFKHKDNPARVCYEVYGIDRLTGIRYSVALCGTRKAAQKALELYLDHITPPDACWGKRPDYSRLFFVEQTTIGGYRKSRDIEMTRRYRLHLAYEFEARAIYNYWEQILERITACALAASESTSAEYPIGDNSDVAELERKVIHCTAYRITKRLAEKESGTVELVLELNFVQGWECAYSDSPELPDASSQIQGQSAVIFKGTHSALNEFASDGRLGEVCKSYFCQAVKNHYYGFSPCNYLYNTPVYKDAERTTDDFERCFMGFLLKQGHADYMPKGKKIWPD